MTSSTSTTATPFQRVGWRWLLLDGAGALVLAGLVVANGYLFLQFARRPNSTRRRR